MKTLWAQRASLGSTVYYIAKMPVEELVNSVGLAIELPEWKDMTPDEKMQREPDINRVVNEICPYFTNDLDRFFGSLIIDIYSGFEDIKSFQINLQTSSQCDYCYESDILSIRIFFAVSSERCYKASNPSETLEALAFLFSSLSEQRWHEHLYL